MRFASKLKKFILLVHSWWSWVLKDCRLLDIKAPFIGVLVNLRMLAPSTDGSYDRAVPTAVTRICPRVPTSSTSDTFRYGSSRQLVSHLLHFMFLVIFKELTFHRFSSIYTSIKRFRPHCRHELLPSFIVLAFVRLADIKEPTNPWQSLDKQVVRNQQWTFKR